MTEKPSEFAQLMIERDKIAARIAAAQSTAIADARDLFSSEPLALLVDKVKSLQDRLVPGSLVHTQALGNFLQVTAAVVQILENEAKPVAAQVDPAV